MWLRSERFSEESCAGAPNEDDEDDEDGLGQEGIPLAAFDVMWYYSGYGHIPLGVQDVMTTKVGEPGVECGSSQHCITRRSAVYWQCIGSVLTVYWQWYYKCKSSVIIVCSQCVACGNLLPSIVAVVMASRSRGVLW
jgi:hypothetical protein